MGADETDPRCSPSSWHYELNVGWGKWKHKVFSADLSVHRHGNPAAQTGFDSNGVPLDDKVMFVAVPNENDRAI